MEIIIEMGQRLTLLAIILMFLIFTNALRAADVKAVVRDASKRGRRTFKRARTMLRVTGYTSIVLTVIYIIVMVIAMELAAIGGVSA